MSKFSSRIDFEKICRFCGIVFCWCGRGDVNKTYSKRLFPSCPKPLFQSEAVCKDIALIFFLFYTHANKTHFHKKGFALSLVLKVRVFGVRKQARSQGLSSPTRNRREPWERGWLGNGPLSSMLETFFTCGFSYTHCSQRYSLGVERKGWKTGARVRLFVWLFSFISPNPTFQGSGKWWRGLNLAQPNLMRASAQATVRWVRVELFPMFWLVRI